MSFMLVSRHRLLHRAGHKHEEEEEEEEEEGHTSGVPSCA